MKYIFQGNHNKDSISDRMSGLMERLKELETAAIERETDLNRNYAFLQFMWKTDVVDSWIGE